MPPHLEATFKWKEIKVLRSCGAFSCTRFSGPDKVANVTLFHIPWMHSNWVRARNNLESLCAVAFSCALTVGATTWRWRRCWSHPGSCHQKEPGRDHTRREALMGRGEGLGVQQLTICPQDASCSDESPTNLESIASQTRVLQEAVFPCNGETWRVFSISWVSLTRPPLWRASNGTEKLPI